jgi:predicted Fe-Mo cluster-binding NifX family protein
VVIAAGIGQRALNNLNHHGIEVRIGQPGRSVESVAAAWLAGQLASLPNSCAHLHGAVTGHECRLCDYLEEHP